MRLLVPILLILSGCTVNQQHRIQEVFAPRAKYYSRIQDIHIVQKSVETDAFSFSIEPVPVNTQKGFFPGFILKASSLPLEERFIFARIDCLKNKIEPECEFEVLQGGGLQIYKPQSTFMENDLAFTASEGLRAGTPIDFVIVSKKEGVFAKARFIPYPLVAKGESGEALEAVVSHPLGTRFSLSAKGFSPQECLTLKHLSGKTEEILQIEADESGAFTIGLNPAILGKLGGEATLRVQKADGVEIVLEYPWGCMLDKKTWEERALFPMLLVANREIEEKDASSLAALLD